jgi:glycosyltransferase involved in cell wall biosynthesis
MYATRAKRAQPQAMLTGASPSRIARDLSYADPARVKTPSAMLAETSPMVAVVTRTKDRPLLLPRARESVAGQSFRDFVWVVVNDGGDRAVVDREAQAAERDGVDVAVVHRESSTGMEAASNAGVAARNSRYVVIHDDDDSWSPEFLEATTGFLEDNPHYGGVVTQAVKVEERLTGQAVQVTGRRIYNPNLHHIRMADLATQNLFPPISFLFRRWLYDEVAGFDESLPVLGDWDFNLRCCLAADLAVIPRPMANYHFRELQSGADGRYGNTVRAGVSQHVEYDAIYRNRKLREDLAANKLGLGMLLYHATLSQRLGERIDVSGPAGLARLSLSYGRRFAKRIFRRPL